MRRITLLLGVIAVLAAIGVAGWYKWVGASRTEKPPVDWSADMQTAAEGHNHFAFALYAKIREKEKGKNVFFSPYSAHTALAMTATGARGTTREQMLKVLHLPDDDQKLLASGDMARFYAHPRKDFELSVANAIWGQKGLGWRPEFLEGQRTRFGSELLEADFVANPNGERERINHWVEGQTRDRIKELLLQGQVNRQTTMVLTNAIYFKGKWGTAFDPKKTRDDTFHCADDSRVQVKMMHANLKCGYARFDEVTLVELPYKGGELSMVVILPWLPDGLPALEKQLNPETLAKWLGELKDQGQMEVSLPKFKLESRYELPEYLQALGMKDAFSRSADFSGIANPSPGWISEVAHKAFVEVNEEGTEAAAATGVVLTADSRYPPPFYANHPFLFLIRDTKHGTILFMGAVERP